MAVPVFCINRTVDRDRWYGFAEAARAVGVSPTRIVAVDAHAAGFAAPIYADLIGGNFWGGTDIKPGAVGCFLSHIKAWQQLIDSGEPYALICEDDARLVAAPDEMLSDVIDTGADLIFANDRMTRWAEGQGSAVPLADVIDTISRAGRGEFRAPGADCYLLSRSGADVMLDRAAAHRITCGVDWALIAAGLAQTPDPKSDLGTSPGRELAFLAALLPTQDKPLKAGVLARPLTELDRAQPSVLDHEHAVPIPEFIKVYSNLTHTEYVSTLLLGGATLNFAGRSGNDPVMVCHREGRLWEAEAIAALLARFPAGGTFVDIGAHLGNHTVAMARLGRAGRVIAVEPNAEITRLLGTNLDINDVADRVEIHGPGLALGKAEGAGWLLRNRRKSSETMVKSDLSEEDRARAEEVRLIPGDALLAETKVDAIKIDTSGSEVEVLRGLTGTLESQRPMLLIDHGSGQTDRIMKVLEPLGYRLDASFESARRNRTSSLILPSPRRPQGDGR